MLTFCPLFLSSKLLISSIRSEVVAVVAEVSSIVVSTVVAIVASVVASTVSSIGHAFIINSANEALRFSISNSSHLAVPLPIAVTKSLA